MARYCTVCCRPDRAAIDQKLLDRVPERVIAEQHPGPSRGSLQRHRAHIPAALAKAKEAQEIAQADSVLEHVRSLEDRSETLYGAATSILARAEQAADLPTALRAIREAESVLRGLRQGAELRGKLSGELKSIQERNQPNAPTARVAVIFVPTFADRPAPAPIRISPPGVHALPAPETLDAELVEQDKPTE